MTDAAHSSKSLTVRVQRIEWEAEGVISVELRRPDNEPLPEFTAGAHIDIHLPNGLVRSYSLSSDSSDRQRYVVGVGLDAASRGGSSYIHNQLRVGQMLTIDGPRNHFPLVEDAEQVVFIAGGIGITPLFCMMRRLNALGRKFELHYATRNRRRMAFLTAVQALGPVHVHCDEEQGGRPLDLAAIIRKYPAGTHFYCCGPTPMLTAFEQATEHLPADLVHVEYFSPKPQDPAAESNTFTVVLARTGREYVVPADKSILDVLVQQGVSVESSCLDGICGTCEIRVLEGVPDHRDSVLTKAEQEANKSMMICVSRCKGDRLVLDL
ncbi:PDR/VanB family oxidoreductase [uncultured Ferrovibrio sp.]|jgi:ferredoxin-NADP reductase|uniref:PDR/VanB family oxidoreductase n=1 Tax=uncultured Ferrovibrio sp. TaxID=1576913 RepID=UPI0026387F43|nr:PDR/VanB family oxidoreductase [uncultured Ferrovibrio sp.]